MSAFQNQSPTRTRKQGIGEPPPTHLIRVAATEDFLADEFVNIVGAPGAGSTQPGDPSRRIGFEVDRPDASPDEVRHTADGVLLLLRHLDTGSFKAANAILAGLPAGFETALVIATVRESGQSEFKMSCACGQKLYVSDSQVGKQGRCPVCGKKFVLPAEEALIQSRLPMDPPAQLIQLVRGHRTLYQCALNALLEKIDRRTDALKRQTMRIQIADDTTVHGI